MNQRRISGRGGGVGRVVRGLVALCVVLPLSVLSTTPAQAAGTGKVFNGGATVYKQPNTGAGSWGTIANSVSVTLQCGVNAQSMTYSGITNTLWHEVVFNGQVGFVPDVWLLTGTNGLAAGEGWCASGQVILASPLNVLSGPYTTGTTTLGSLALNSRVTLYCGTTAGSSVGGSTLWHLVGISNTQGWVPDYNMLTGYNTLPPGEISCPSVPPLNAGPKDAYPVSALFEAARTANGGRLVVGGSVNAVHAWSSGSTGGNVQDFGGGSNGADIIMQSSKYLSAAFVVKLGFWTWYKANKNQGITLLGYPTSNEYGYQDGVRQDFEKGFLRYSAGTNVVFSTYPTADQPRYPLDLTGTERWTAETYPGHWTWPYLNPYLTFWSSYAASDWNLPGNADAGRKVSAIQVGVVQRVDTSQGLVVIRHTVPLPLKNGTTVATWFSQYGHMTGIPTQVLRGGKWVPFVGATVSKGEQIGVVGMAGADNHHLHFVISKGLSSGSDIKSERTWAISPFWIKGDLGSSALVYADSGSTWTTIIREPAGLYEATLLAPCCSYTAAP